MQSLKGPNQLHCTADLFFGREQISKACHCFSHKNVLQIEMYADGNARGGVLEPEGIVEIKFRAADLIALMHRLDPIILELKAGSQPGTETAVKKREAELLPVYRQVAC